MTNMSVIQIHKLYFYKFEKFHNRGINLKNLSNPQRRLSW